MKPNPFDPALCGRLAGGAPDLSTPAGRALAFNERIDTLTGQGMSYNAAIDKMRQTPGDAELLVSMGDPEAKPIKPADLSTPEKRRDAFNARLDVLTGPLEKGGHGLVLNTALQFMRDNEEDAPLLRAMGAELPAAQQSRATDLRAALERGVSIGLATNVAAVLSEEEWQPLAEYGETDYWRQEDGGMRKYKQVFTRAQAEKMVLAHNALRLRQGADFRGLPIYRGHPDADPKQWPDDTRYGGVIALEARDKALHVKLAWNDLGRRNKEQGYFIYPSPAWWFDEREAKSQGVIMPAELSSVGLTNRPRIPTSKPWTNCAPVPGPVPLSA